MAAPRLDMDRSPQHPFFDCVQPIIMKIIRREHSYYLLDEKNEIWGPWPTNYNALSLIGYGDPSNICMQVLVISFIKTLTKRITLVSNVRFQTDSKTHRKRWKK